VGLVLGPGRAEFHDSHDLGDGEGVLFKGVLVDERAHDVRGGWVVVVPLADGSPLGALVDEQSALFVGDAFGQGEGVQSQSGVNHIFIGRQFFAETKEE
jgi:hypothetical protein